MFERVHNNIAPLIMTTERKCIDYHTGQVLALSEGFHLRMPQADELGARSYNAMIPTLLHGVYNAGHMNNIATE